MLFKPVWRAWALVTILAVMIVWRVVSAFSGHSATTTVQINLLDPTATAAAPPGPPGPGGVSSTSALVMIQGLKERRLVLWSLNGDSPPLEIDRQSVWPLLPSPDGNYILYSTERSVMVLDRAARRAVIVGTLPQNGQLLAAQWSPDSHAVAYVVQDASYRLAYYTLPDGSFQARLMTQVPSGLPLDVAWLADGSPVSIALGIGPVGGLQAQYQAYDPARDDVIPLPSDVAVIQPWSPWRSPDGRQQVYAMKTWEDARYKGVCGTGPLAAVGRRWLYAEIANHELSEKPPAIFKIKGIYMDRPTWLNDGRILFRATADKTCTDLPSGLYAGYAGQKPQLLVEAEPGYVSDQSDKLLWSTSYALSPDQTQVAWTENNVEAGRGWVHLTPINGGPPQTLFETAPVTNEGPFAFQDREMILYFIWLP